MESRFGLPVDTILDASYRIVRIVGSGGFGITYEAEDMSLGTLVAIKEYYPFDFGDRDDSMNVHPRSERHRQTFDWGRLNFLQEARTLARFEHPSIVRVTRVFETNSTAYMVMGFERGQSFEDWLNGLGRLPTQAELDAIVAPILSALEMLHAANFLHRDIAPDNVIVRADGSPVLLDFGSARQAVAQKSRKLTGIVKAGYSPHEQYSSDSRLQGPWSDFYALGGTLYRAVTGLPPDEATLRVGEDTMPSAASSVKGGGYRASFLAGIDACLRVRHAERPRSVAQLRPMLTGKGIPVPTASPAQERTRRISRPPVLRRTQTAYARSRLQLERLGRASLRAGHVLRHERLPQIRKQVNQQIGRFTQANKRARDQLGHLSTAAFGAAAVHFGRVGEGARRAAGSATRSFDFEPVRRAGAFSIEWLRDKWWQAIVAVLAVVGGIYASYALVRPPSEIDEYNARIEAQRQSEEANAARARAETEASRLALVRRQQDEKAAEERARQDAEAKRQAEEAAAEAARRKADKEAEERRVASLTLGADERAALVKRVQELLKARRCYDGSITGSGADTQAGLDRFVETVHKKGTERPARIELAKATASDFDTWLREAGDVKGDVCAVARPKATERPRRAPASPSSRGGGGGGGGGGSIQGVR